MAEAQLTNAASLADSPVFKRSRGRPKKDDTQRRPVPPPAFLQKEKRPRGRPRIHPPKDPSAVKRPRGRPKVNPDKPPKPKRPRGRPKGSKNKEKTGEELKNGTSEVKVKGKRGRPKMHTGLKVKIVVRKPSTSSAESTTNGRARTPSPPSETPDTSASPSKDLSTPLSTDPSSSESS